MSFLLASSTWDSQDTSQLRNFHQGNQQWKCSNIETQSNPTIQICIHSKKPPITHQVVIHILNENFDSISILVSISTILRLAQAFFPKLPLLTAKEKCRGRKCQSKFLSPLCSTFTIPDFTTAIPLSISFITQTYQTMNKERHERDRLIDWFI